MKKKDKRKVHGVPQSQTAALPRHQEEDETDKTKQAQIEQTISSLIQISSNFFPTFIEINTCIRRKSVFGSFRNNLNLE